MPRGAAVIRYAGPRGVVWRIKYIDASGRQVTETLGPDTEWNRKRAERALGARLADVEKGLKRPKRLTWEEFADRFFAEYLPTREIKPSTLDRYESIRRLHLDPFFGRYSMREIADEGWLLVEQFIAQKRKEGLATNTLLNLLRLLHLMFNRAVKWHMLGSNPVDEVDQPRMPRGERQILTPGQIAAILQTLERRVSSSDGDERTWWQLTGALFFVTLTMALRLGESLGLRWQAVNLEAGRIAVRETWSLYRTGTPKSQASRRTVSFGEATKLVLVGHFERSTYTAGTDLVFCQPFTGRHLDPTKARDYLRDILDEVGVPRSFRPFHDLRHTALTWDAKAGLPPSYIQAKAGHSNFR